MSRLELLGLALTLLVLATAATVSVGVTIKIRAYSDNSIAVTAVYEGEANSTAEGKIHVSLEIMDDGFKISGNASLTGTARIKYPGYPSAPGENIDLMFNFTRVKDAPKGVVDLCMKTWDSTGRYLTVSAKDITIEMYPEEDKAVIAGKLYLSMDKETASVLTPILLLANKQTINGFLGEYNITGIKIEELNTAVLNTTSAGIEFRIALTNTTAYALAADTMPSAAYLKIHAGGQTMTAVFKIAFSENINKYIEGLSAALKKLQAKAPAPTLRANETVVYELLDEFTKNFTLLPSKGEVLIELERNKTSIELTTPRILYKKASSPSDTLHALYWFAEHALKTLENTEQPIKIQIGRQKTLHIEVENGAAYLDGAPVTNITPADLARIVIKTAPATPTTTLQPQTSSEALAAAVAGIALAISFLLIVKKHV